MYKVEYDFRNNIVIITNEFNDRIILTPLCFEIKKGKLYVCVKFPDYWNNGKKELLLLENYSIRKIKN